MLNYYTQSRRAFLLVILTVMVCLSAGVYSALAQQSPIHIGENIQVSKAHSNYSLGEVLLSADPVDPNHLLGCAVVYVEQENRRWTTAYFSSDRGKTWQSTLETKQFADSADPACAVGRNGLASYIAIGMQDEDPKTKAHPYGLGLYRSTDGGKTWEQQEDMPMSFQGIDRESMTIDNTEGKFANRIYIAGVSKVKDLGGGLKIGFGIWRSRDGGKTFDALLKRAPLPNHYLLEPGSSVVLSDGTVVSLFGDLRNSDGYSVERNGDQSNATLESVTTTDGGDNVSEAVKIDDFYMVWDHKEASMIAMGMPTMAVDSGDGPFRDRVYAVWADERDGRSEIRMSYSPDKGKSWSKSIVIDDVPYLEGAKGPQNFLPTVAVNKAGVVAVTWYDRRESPDRLGWYVRVRASLDGGETWLPSVRVSEKPNTFASPQKIFTFAASNRGAAGASDIGMEPNDFDSFAAADKDKPKSNGPTHVSVAFQGRQFFAGDYAGLAADAGGTFHAWWIDDRTGLAQIWTAPITIDGKSVRNGDPALADLKDVSSDINLEVVSSNYDRSSNTETLGVRLKNNSDKTISGPVKLRLLSVSSAIGTAAAANADNKLPAAGAVWDLSSLLKDNSLKPEEKSEVKQLVFNIKDPLDLMDGKVLREKVLDFDVRILAQKEEEKSSSESH